MSPSFLRSAQIFVILNCIIQIIWFSHIIFPNEFVLYFEQVIFLAFAVSIINLCSAFFCFIYLSKKEFKIAAKVLIFHALYYTFLLYNWYLLINQNQSLEKYVLMQYGLFVFDLLLGVTLIFSKTKTSKLIKSIGIIIAVSSALNIGRELAFANELNLGLQIFDYVLNLIWCAVCVLWFLSFRNEIKNGQNENEEILDV